MKTKIVLNALCGAVLIVSFQNCSKTSFASNTGDGTLQSLSGDGVKGGGGDSMGDGSSGILEQDGSTCVVVEDQADSPNSNHKRASCSHMKNSCDQDADNSPVVCIIRANGKSQKLGLVDGVLQEVTSMAQAVCVSKAECLGDIAQSFNILGAYDRGACLGNPNVMRLSDAQVKQLLGL